LEDVIRWFRETLFKAFFDWLETNKIAIGKWYKTLYNEGKKAEADCDTAMKIMGTTLWMFNMIANCGVMAGLGPNKVSLQGLAKELDEKSTLRLLHLMASCLCLQGLPKDVISKSIPIISSKKFSLKLYEPEV
jgi:hypothetical protein